LCKIKLKKYLIDEAKIQTSDEIKIRADFGPNPPTVKLLFGLKYKASNNIDKV